MLYRDGVVYSRTAKRTSVLHRDGDDQALDARRRGDLKEDAFKWKTLGFLPTYASPVMDGERLYTVDNSAIVAAFDLQSGKRLWERGLGTLQKGSPVLADGKRTSGPKTASSSSCDRPQPASKFLTKTGSARRRTPSRSLSPIVADGRVYVTSMEATYAIGKRVPRGKAGASEPRLAEAR